METAYYLVECPCILHESTITTEPIEPRVKGMGNCPPTPPLSRH